MENKRLSNFVTSHSMTAHPLARAKKKTRIRYYATLDYFVRQCVGDDEYANARLLQYRTMLVGNEAMVALTNKNRDDIIRSIVNAWFWLRPWRWKYRYWLLCDLALVLLEEVEIKSAYEQLSKFLSRKQTSLLTDLFAILWNENEVPSRLSFAEELINQFRVNRRFLDKPLTRILVTATMSAGKSTLINAFVGADVLEARNEACTNRTHRVFNKPYDDGKVNRVNDDIAIYIEAFSGKRICFIDTPGVNSTQHPTHREITQAEIRAGQYDVIFYVFNARYTGVTDDDSHLLYVLENKPPDLSVIFILNQLDAFNEDDSIDESINKLRKFLDECGVREPIICPISAKAGRLARQVSKGVKLDKIEEIWYVAFAESFNTLDSDLSVYYGEANNTDEIPLLRQCGLIGLEQILLMI